MHELSDVNFLSFDQDVRSVILAGGQVTPNQDMQLGANMLHRNYLAPNYSTRRHQPCPIK